MADELQLHVALNEQPPGAARRRCAVAGLAALATAAWVGLGVMLSLPAQEIGTRGLYTLMGACIAVGSIATRAACGACVQRT